MTSCLNFINDSLVEMNCIAIMMILGYQQQV